MLFLASVLPTVSLSLLFRSASFSLINDVESGVHCLRRFFEISSSLFLSLRFEDCFWNDPLKVTRSSTSSVVVLSDKFPKDLKVGSRSLTCLTEQRAKTTKTF